MGPPPNCIQFNVFCAGDRVLRHRAIIFSMKFLLTSSGIRNQYIANALAELVGKPLSETSILFVPTAANTGTDDKSWMIEDLAEFRKQNFKSIDVVDIATPPEVWTPHVLAADVICFGGGDEKYLARVMEQGGMKEFLLPLLSTKVYMGISAGSMVAGHFLPEGLSEVVFPEEDFGSTQGTPMKLYDFIFIPHLNSDWFKHVSKEVLDTIKDKFGMVTYVTDDETAIKIDGAKIEIVGKGNYLVFNK